ncbi:unnamed protein product [Cylindrotheca closterium]|uniref:Glutaredoxin n=1 Tax=Cylindrotheca closterium TaxID=2856 RepID=A0AAD2CN10_9STRA|nr:unnamed protein product [Cylindrotheca closterium]
MSKSSSASSLVEVSSSPLNIGTKSKAVLLFGASWHEACPQLEALLSALAGTAPDVFFAKIDAEENSDLSEQFQVTMVPTIILLNGGPTTDHIIVRMEGGFDPSHVTIGVQRLLSANEGLGSAEDSSSGPAVRPLPEDPEKELAARLDTLIKRDSVMLFMKGDPSAPKCGFSREAVELLQKHEVPFGSFDILSDDSVRQGLKKHSNWPTYPQIYVNGNLVGGLDVLKETAEEGSLKEQWGVTGPATVITPLQDRLASLVKRSDVMIFMKGLPSAPKCGFSRQMIGLLDESGVAYDAFNILEDSEVRQGLKEFSNWPTYPQLYVKGELVGGLDICKELAEDGDLVDTLKQ